jgi:calcineurin-like phosphoesterase family protein
MIWIWSDLHLFHGNVITYERRPFADVAEMNAVILRNWRETVKKRDTIICLGDVSLSNKENTAAAIKNMPGHKVLVLGNHDRARSVRWWHEVGFDEVYKYPIILDEFYMLSHEPLYVGPEMPYVNVHGHTHSSSFDNPRRINVSVEVIGYKPVSFEGLKYRDGQELGGVVSRTLDEIDNSIRELEQRLLDSQVYTREQLTPDARVILNGIDKCMGGRW